MYHNRLNLPLLTLATHRHHRVHGVKVAEMLMLVEWQVAAAGGKWCKQVVVSERHARA
ncbi:hypothetical protein Hanom_Chr16g01451731 [Helianthus anomalus]